MSISLLQHTQGIQGYHLLRNEYSSDTYTAHLISKEHLQRCVEYKSLKVTATAVSQREIKALPFGTKKTILKITMHRLRCHGCGVYRMERIPFTSTQSSRVTKHLVRTIVALRKHMSIKAVANYYELPWATVKDIEKNHLKQKHQHVNLREVKAMGIDEIFMGKTLGEKGYLTIVRDLETGAVLEVAKGKKGSVLNDYC